MAFAGGFPGKTPRTPHPRILKTDVGKVQGQAIAGNIANFGDLGKLGDLYSTEELGQIEKQIPGYGDALTAGGAAANEIFSQGQALLHGEVPQDVQDFVRRVAAQQAMSGGYGGSQMARNLVLRDLGLTSLQGIQQGAQLAGQGTNVLGGVSTLARQNMLPTSSFLVTPGQAISVDQENRQRLYNALQLSYNNQAQPNPLHNIILGLTEAYLGSVGVGGKGGMGGSAAPAQSGGGYAGIPSTQDYQGYAAAPPPVFNYIPQSQPVSYSPYGYDDYSIRGLTPNLGG